MTTRARHARCVAAGSASDLGAVTPPGVRGREPLTAQLPGAAPRRTAVRAAATVAVLLAVTACSSTQAPDPTATGGTVATTSTAAASAVSTAPVAVPTGVGSGQPQRSTPTAPTALDPALAGVDRSSVDAVAVAVVTALNTADTRVDAGPNDAATRAVGLLTADYAAAVLNTPPLRSSGAQWNTWTTQGVQLTATVESLPDDRPADTPSTATRIYLVTQTPTTATGSVLDPVVTVAYVALQRGQAGWAVAQVEQR